MSKVEQHVWIGGMTCINCQNKIEHKLQRTKGVEQVQVSYRTGEATIAYDTEQISFTEIQDVVQKLGYSVKSTQKEAVPDVTRTICTLIIILSLYLILERSGILTLLVPSQLADRGMGYGMLFIVGVLTSVHCVAMCGGIGLSQTISAKENKAGDGNQQGKTSMLGALMPTLQYHLGRVVSYTTVGFVLGLAGMLFGGGMGTGMSAFVQGILKMAAGIFMVIMGINMLGLFPPLRRFRIRLPKGLQMKIAKSAATGKTPLWVGLLNGLMPCGPLQSMQIIAFASGNPVTGALSMLVFALGTVPLMLGLGSAVSLLGRRFAKSVTTVGAILVVVLGLALFSQGGSLSGMRLLPGLGSETKQADGYGSMVEIADGVQYVHSTLQPGAYPNFTVQKGIPVHWTIDAPEGSINGCNYKIILQEYGIEQALEEGENQIQFIPERAGEISYTCWMGMIRGTIQVTEES
ncbi:MAG: sulfite exporter TauE/SafE family protein [Lachnospiraceae bacterium]|nr:sulfite exporter TauE/SafE family protein [Lachnospiraceae bacterium]